MADARRPRIFQIGFNRCGTKSLAVFFEKNGYSVAHWKGGKVAAGIELARREGRPLLSHVGRYDVFTDMEKINVSKLWRKRFPARIFRRLLKRMDPGKDVTPIYAYKYFRELDEQYPGSRFILNTRDVDRWVASRLRFNEGKYRSCLHGDRIHADDSELSECWKKEWHAHHEDVTGYFSGRPRDLIVFDIERDGIARLVEFLRPDTLDPRHWGKTNAST